MVNREELVYNLSSLVHLSILSETLILIDLLDKVNLESLNKVFKSHSFFLSLLLGLTRSFSDDCPILIILRIVRIIRILFLVFKIESAEESEQDQNLGSSQFTIWVRKCESLEHFAQDLDRLSGNSSRLWNLNALEEGCDPKLFLGCSIKDWIYNLRKQLDVSSLRVSVTEPRRIDQSNILELFAKQFFGDSHCAFTCLKSFTLLRLLWLTLIQNLNELIASRALSIAHLAKENQLRPRSIAPSVLDWRGEWVESVHYFLERVNELSLIFTLSIVDLLDCFLESWRRKELFSVNVEFGIDDLRLLKNLIRLRLLLDLTTLRNFLLVLCLIFLSLSLLFISWRDQFTLLSIWSAKFSLDFR